MAGHKKTWSSQSLRGIVQLPIHTSLAFTMCPDHSFAPEIGPPSPAPSIWSDTYESPPALLIDPPTPEIESATPTLESGNQARLATPPGTPTGTTSFFGMGTSDTENLPPTANVPTSSVTTASSFDMEAYFTRNLSSLLAQDESAGQLLESRKSTFILDKYSHVLHD